MSHLTPEESRRKLKEIRVLSLFDPYYFQRVVLRFDKIVDYLHGKELSEFVGNLQRGQLKQWIEWPRGHFKTTCFTIGLSVWFVLPHDASDEDFAIAELGIDREVWRARMKLHNRDFVQLLAFETLPNACRKIEEIKRIFETNVLFKSVFPEIAYNGTERPWTSEKLTIRRTEKGQRVGEASFQAAGVGTALQSQHYDIIWEDDIVGKDARDSPHIMAGTIEWHQLLNGIRNGPNLGMKTWRFGVSNMWAYNDLNNHVRKREHDWLFHTRKLTEMNQETGVEEPIFPVDGMGEDAYTPPIIEGVKAGMTEYDFSCQFYHEPIRPGSESVSKENLHTYTVEVGGEIICSCGGRYFTSGLRRYGHIDPNNAKATSTSCAAIAIVGLSTDKHTFLLDYYTGKPSYGEFYDKIVKFNDEFWPETWSFEDVGHQNMIAFYLRKMEQTPEFKASSHQCFRRIVPATTKGKGKEIRIADYLFPVIEKGKFAVRKSQSLFSQMLGTFPNPTFDHDYDLLDALSQGPLLWRWPAEESAERQLKQEEQDMLAALGKPYGYRAQVVQ